MKGHGKNMGNGPMLNAYPDSLGGRLSDIVSFLEKPEVQGAFDTFYILPSLFHSDLDRGFSVIDYGINRELADRSDLENIKNLGIGLKLDFVLNHISARSKQFQDILEKGRESKYWDFFIDWNRFWNGNGKMMPEGYIQPNPDMIKNMFFRKSGLPFLMVRLADGTKAPFWNTFYQEVQYKRPDAWDYMQHMDIQYSEAEKLEELVNSELDAGKKPAEIPLGEFENYKNQVLKLLEEGERYLGQMDLNLKSPMVWEYYAKTLKTLAEYGAEIVRLDAFAYAAKEPGAKNFLNEPETWDILNKIQKMAEQYHLNLLPEIHATYQEKVYEVLADKGYMIYDFFLPGLVIDALEIRNGEKLVQWAEELYKKEIRAVNMLGCHDGIPLLDLKGLLPEERIEQLTKVIVERGGMIKNLHGQKQMYYQLNATYYSALGEDDLKMVLARAIQIFMPGKPQVWYLDLMAGRNDYEAVKRAGEGGHKEINRTNLTVEEMERGMERTVVKQQLELLHFRNTFPAFSFDARFRTEQKEEFTEFRWEKDGSTAILRVDFRTLHFHVIGMNERGDRVFYLESC